MNQAVHPGTSQLENREIAEHNSASASAVSILLSCRCCTEQEHELIQVVASLPWFLGMAPPAGSWGQTVVSSSEVSLRSKAGFWGYLFLMPTLFTNPRDTPSFPLPSSRIAVEPSGDVHEERLLGLLLSSLGGGSASVRCHREPDCSC